MKNPNEARYKAMKEARKDRDAWIRTTDPVALAAFNAKASTSYVR